MFHRLATYCQANSFYLPHYPFMLMQVNQWMVGVKKLVAVAKQQETKDDN